MNKSEFKYQQRKPEESILYQTVRDHWPSFKNFCQQDGRGLPDYVTNEFKAYLECGQLYYGFTRRKCNDCHREHFLPFSCKKKGFCPGCCSRRSAETIVHLIDQVLPFRPYRQWVVTLPISLRYIISSNRKLQRKIHSYVVQAISKYYRDRALALGIKDAKAGSITFVQRFGGLLNLNIHFHILFLDGVYHRNSKNELIFRNIPPPSKEQLEEVMQRVVDTIIRFLQRRGILSKEFEIDYLEHDQLAEFAPNLARSCQASSLNYIAFGQNAGYPVRKIGKSFGFMEAEAVFSSDYCLAKNGFTMHAETTVKSNNRSALERLVGYMSRPPLATNRLEQTNDGQLFYRLKRQYSDGTKGIKLTPEELIEKLVALIPPPWQNQICYNGVFAPASPIRSQIVLNPKADKDKPICDKMTQDEDSAEWDIEDQKNRPKWSTLLKRIFGLDMDRCQYCGGPMKLVSVINERSVINKILDHIGHSTDPPDISTNHFFVQQELDFSTNP